MAPQGLGTATTTVAGTRMSAGSYPPSVRLISEEREPRVISNGVLGMALFVMTEIMLFAGMISAFNIVRASSAIWPPPDQPRLPIEETAFNTAALLLSGVCLYVAQRRFRTDRSAARWPLIAAILLGGFFVVFQGWEWARMLAQGLTLTSSTLGSFFYLIVGTPRATRDRGDRLARPDLATPRIGLAPAESARDHGLALVFRGRGLPPDLLAGLSMMTAPRNSPDTPRPSRSRHSRFS